MSQPREVHPGVTYHVTHTTIGRMFLLKPDAVVNQVMLFCLFRAAEMFGVLVHTVMVESNHFHTVVTDVRGELSRFMHWVDMMTAKNLIAHYENLYPAACPNLPRSSPRKCAPSEPRRLTQPGHRSHNVQSRFQKLCSNVSQPALDCYEY